jgi:formate hydrogenlyase subunit 4
MSFWALTILQACILVIAAPLFAGLIKWIKCQLQNRSGPSVFQPYRNLYKLFHKDVIIPTTASKIFVVAPYVIFVAIIACCTIVPLISSHMPQTVIADVIVLVGLFALARFFLALAGMDVGTAFGGMGSSREMMIASLAEPALLLALFTLALSASSTNLTSIINYCVTNQPLLQPSLIFAAVSFALVAIAETGRIPVDNPATHLELTMVHEAMILEYSGKYLALLEWSSQIKLLLYSVLLINLFFPWGIIWNDISTVAILVSSFLLLVKISALGVVLSVVENSLAKLRLFRVPNLLSVAFLLSLLGLMIHIVLE